MIKSVKILLVIAVILPIGFFIARQVLVQYDQRTTGETLKVAARELAVGASEDDMRAFLERHTTRFAIDDTLHHVYGGFLPQSAMDRWLFDRQVQINLKFDDDRRFQTAEVNIYYTSL